MSQEKLPRLICKYTGLEIHMSDVEKLTTGYFICPHCKREHAVTPETHIINNTAYLS